MPRFFLIGTLALSLPAFAKDLPTIAIVGLHQEGVNAEAQTEAVASIVAAIERGDKLDALTEDEVAFAIQGREQIILKEAFLGPGLRLLEDGRVLYDQAEPEEAIPILEESADTLKLGMATASDENELWEAWMYLGTAKLKVEDADGARAAYASAVAINHERVPNPGQFAPEVITLHSEVLAEQLANMAKTRIAADADGVTVFVNGVDQGAAPVTVELAPGENHVVARGAEGSHAYQNIMVPPGGDLSVTMSMSHPTLGTAANSKFARARQTGALYKALGEHAEVDLVLLAGVSEGLLMAQLYSPRTDTFSRSLELEYTEVAGDEVATNIGELLGAVSGEGTISSIARASTAAPLDVGANSLLAQMLVNPKKELALPGRTGLPLWTVVAGAGVVGGGAFTVGYVLLREQENIEPNQGTIVIGPIP
jgi:tetratricopeptide (TPR) repeat protein